MIWFGRKVNFGLFSPFWCLLALFFILSCSAPSPKEEDLRVPKLLAEGLRGKEGEELTVSLATDFPDPEFKTDRLNPDRYKPGDLSFVCVPFCPEGMSLDSLTGNLRWTPGFVDAGFHRITFAVTSEIFSSENALVFIISDTDRGPAASVSDATFFVKEAEVLNAGVAVSDPDGDETFVSCIDGCRSWIKVDQAGGLSLTPGYSDGGNYELTALAKSQPLKRGIVLNGLTKEEADLEASLREELTKQLINRGTSLEALIKIFVQVENVDRAPSFEKELYSFSVDEGKQLIAKLTALDDDSSVLVYGCENCPEGASLSSSTGELVYNPSFQAAGSYEFTVTAFSLEQPEVKALTKIAIEVKNVNRAPRFINPATEKTVREGEVLNFSFSGSDPDVGDPLIFSCESGCPDGFYIAPSGIVIWSPGHDQSGVYQITAELSDGEASVKHGFSVRVDHVNRPPYFVAAPFTVETQSLLNVRITYQVKDDDVEDVGKILLTCIEGCSSVKIFNSVQRVINWQTTHQDVGTHNFKFSLTDGTATIFHDLQIDVERTDRAPVFTNSISVTGDELQPLSFSIQASDPDGDKVTYSCQSSCPNGMTVDPVSGLINWTPTAQQSGIYSTVFRATSIASWDVTSVRTTNTVATIFIRNFNRPPQIITQPAVALVINEGGHETTSHLSARDFPYASNFVVTDPDLDPLFFFCSDSCPAGLIVNQVTGAISFEPAYNQGSVLGTTYKNVIIAATDSEFIVRSSPINFTVFDVNRPPVTVSPSSSLYTVNEQATLKFSLSATDADQDSLSYSCSQNCPLGLFINSLTGEVTWTPSYSQAMQPPANLPYENIVFSVADQLSSVSFGAVSIKVVNVNRKPVLGAINSIYTVYEGGHSSASYLSPTNSPLSIMLPATDPDGDPLTFTVQGVSNFPGGLTVNSATGEVSFTPSYCRENETNCNPKLPGVVAAKLGGGAYGPVVFAVSDGMDSVQYGSVMVNVINVDRPPVLSGSPQSLLNIYEFSSPDNLSAAIAQRNPDLFPNVIDSEFLVSDPDGDPVSVSCRVAYYDNTATTESGVTGSFVDEPCLPGGGAFFFPSSAKRGIWSKSEIMRLSAVPGGYSVSYQAKSYNDSAFFNEPFNFSYQFTSASAYGGAPITLPFIQSVRVHNTDQMLKIYRDNLNAQLNLTNGEYSLLIEENAAREFFLSPPSVSVPSDPDAASEEFDDTVEFGCRYFPTGVSTDESEPCTGLVSEFFSVAASGVLTVAPNYRHAKLNNEPYLFEVYLESRTSPLQFDQSEYPPQYDSVFIRVSVINKDRAPVFTNDLGEALQGFPFIPTINVSVREPCGDAPIGTPQISCPLGPPGDTTGNFSLEVPYGAIDKTGAVDLFVKDFDDDAHLLAGIGSTEEPSQVSVLGCRKTAMTAETAIECGLTGCTDYGEAAGFLGTCPSFISISPAEGSGHFKFKAEPKSYEDARYLETQFPPSSDDIAPIYVIAQTTGCPLSFTGWAGCEIQGTMSESLTRYQTLSVTVRNQKRKPSPVTVSVQNFGTSPSSYGGFYEVLETSSNGIINVSASDPDGDPMIICAGNVTSTTILHQQNIYPKSEPLEDLGVSVSSSNAGAMIHNFVADRVAGSSFGNYVQATGQYVAVNASYQISFPGLSSGSVRNLVNRNTPRRTMGLGFYACSIEKGLIAPSNMQCPTVAVSGPYVCSEPNRAESWSNFVVQGGHQNSGMKVVNIGFWDVDRPPTMSIQQPSSASFSIAESAASQTISFSTTDPDGDGLYVCQSTSGMGVSGSERLLPDTGGNTSNGIRVAFSGTSGISCAVSKNALNSLRYDFGYDTSTKTSNRTFNLNNYSVCYPNNVGLIAPAIGATPPSGYQYYKFPDNGCFSAPGVSRAMTVTNVDRSPQILLNNGNVLRTVDGKDSFDSKFYSYNSADSVFGSFVDQETSPINPLVTIREYISEDLTGPRSTLTSRLNSGQNSEISNLYPSLMEYEVKYSDEDLEDRNSVFLRVCQSGAGVSNLNLIANNPPGEKTYPIYIVNSSSADGSGEKDAVIAFGLDFALFGENTPRESVGGFSRRITSRNLTLCFEACSSDGVCSPQSSGLTNITFYDSDRRSHSPTSLNVLQPVRFTGSNDRCGSINENDILGALANRSNLYVDKDSDALDEIVIQQTGCANGNVPAFCIIPIPPKFPSFDWGCALTFGSLDYSRAFYKVWFRTNAALGFEFELEVCGAERGQLWDGNIFAAGEEPCS